MKKISAQKGFILPVVVCLILVVSAIAGGVFNYALYGTRTATVYTTTSLCRLAAQTALDRSKADIFNQFKRYHAAYPSTWDLLSWFKTYTAQSIGGTGYTCTLMKDADLQGATVSVTIQGMYNSPPGDVLQYVHVTLQARASKKTPTGTVVSKTIEETVEYALRRSNVFDYAYFINNYGWFQGSGATANGDIRANGDMSLDGYSYINGLAFAAPNTALNAPGVINITGAGKTRFMSQLDYWASASTQARPTSPPSSGASPWEMGYEANGKLLPYQETLEMPFLGDLDGYRTLANNRGGTLKQNGKTLVEGTYSGVGPSGLPAGADKGCLILDGTSSPIEISGPVVIDSDVVIKGRVKGQGVIYAGRNIHIVGDVTYDNAPAWPKPDTKPDQTVKSNAGKDMLGLAAKGNIVFGDYTDESWVTAIKPYITPPFVKAYACDSTDLSIGYGSTFHGDYTALDGGDKITYTYNSKKKKYLPKGTAPRKYYESMVGDQKVKDTISSTAITRVDAVLFNNHAVMGKIGECQFNGALVSRDEAILYNKSVKFNWDIRLGARSPDGLDFFIYLPMSITPPRVTEWREVL